MPIDFFKNFADTILVAGIANDATSFSVPTGHGDYFPSVGSFEVTVWNSSDFLSAKAARRASPAQAEIMLVTRVGDVFTVVARGQGDTAAVNLNAAGKVYTVSQNVTARALSQIGRDLSEVVIQEDHGFTTNRAVRRASNGEWVLSIATAGNADVEGVVSEVLGPDHFRIVRGGTYESSGLTYGQHYLSESIAGVLSTTPPTTPGAPIVPVYFAISSTVATVNIGRPLAEAAPKHNASFTGTTQLQVVALPMVTQASHGFVDGEAVRQNGSNWVKAIATSYDAASVQGFVTNATPNTFIPAKFGTISKSGLTAGEDYYLSDSVAGAIQLAEPTNATSFRTHVGRAFSDSLLFIDIKEPQKLTNIPLDRIQAINKGVVANISSSDASPSLVPLTEFISAVASNIGTPVVGQVLGITAVSPNVIAGLLTPDASGPVEPISLSGTEINLTTVARGQIITKTLAGNTTLSITGIPSSNGKWFFLVVINPAAHTCTITGGSWGTGGAHVFSTGGKFDILAGVCVGGACSLFLLKAGFDIDVADPVVNSITYTSGGEIVWQFSEPTTQGPNGAAGITYTLSNGSPLTATYGSGAGTSTWTFTPVGTVTAGLTITADYANPGNGIIDIAGNELQSFSGRSVANNAPVEYIWREECDTVGNPPAGWIWQSGSGPVFGSNADPIDGSFSGRFAFGGVPKLRRSIPSSSWVELSYLIKIHGAGYSVRGISIIRITSELHLGYPTFNSDGSITLNCAGTTLLIPAASLFGGAGWAVGDIYRVWVLFDREGVNSGASFAFRKVTKDVYPHEKPTGNTLTTHVAGPVVGGSGADLNADNIMIRPDTGGSSNIVTFDSIIVSSSEILTVAAP